MELIFGQKLELQELFEHLRNFVRTKYHLAGVDTTAHREAVIETLMDRIDKVAELIQKKKVARAQMLKQYMLLGYLCDILNGILEDVGTDEVLKRMEKWEVLAGISEAKSADSEMSGTPKESSATEPRL